tara:strand:+ start:2375 stop:2806 length:432 start_codon:yes stop_codon:yes gene_type:complete
MNIKKSKWVYLYDDRYTEFRDELDALGIFDNLIELYIFCASVGFSENLSIEINKNGKEIARNVEALTNNIEKIKAIALASSQDSDILADENLDQCYEIFSAYVNGGMEHLQNLFETEKLLKDESKIQEILEHLDQKALLSQNV